MHLTLNTSEAEPLGLSVLESLAMARPVVAFAAGGVPEIVQHGVTGWLVEGRGAGPLAAALARAVLERRRFAAMGAAGRAFVVAHASLDAMCRGYAAAYEEVVEAHDGL